jgi:hypothetical protein
MAGKADVRFAGFAENALTSQLMIFYVFPPEFANSVAFCSNLMSFD